MVRATKNDKDLVVDILKTSFSENKSVNYLLPQDAKREQRLTHFMEYSFDVCHMFGDVFLSDDGKACALSLLPDQKKTTLKSIFFDLKFILQAIGISNVGKALRRESQIKRLQPAQPFYYLWFIGVQSSEQKKGIGSKLLTEIIAHAQSLNRAVCLETSNVSNVPWYQKFGFAVYNELDLGYRLSFLKKE